MGQFGVISQCRIDKYVDHLQNLKHLWVEYNPKGAHIEGFRPEWSISAFCTFEKNEFESLELW